MGKHTPGPRYEAGTGNHQGLIVSEATSANVAVAYDKKDAALIANAPAMLAALEEIENHFCCPEQVSRSIASAVLDKVRGEAGA